MSSLYRTQRSRFVLYPPDGKGRDKYIGFNNGGFWKGKEGEVTLKPSYPNFHSFAYYSPKHKAAPFRYYSDGSGRDSYILDHDGGMIKSFTPSNHFHLKDFLRTPESCIYNAQDNSNKKGGRGKTFFVSQEHMKMNDRLRDVERGLIKRLYTQEKHKFALTRNGFLKGHTVYPRYETECKFKEPLKTMTDFEKLKGRLQKVHLFELNKSNNSTQYPYTHSSTEANSPKRIQKIKRVKIKQ